MQRRGGTFPAGFFGHRFAGGKPLTCLDGDSKTALPHFSCLGHHDVAFRLLHWRHLHCLLVPPSSRVQPNESTQESLDDTRDRAHSLASDCAGCVRVPRAVPDRRRDSPDADTGTASLQQWLFKHCVCRNLHQIRALSIRALLAVASTYQCFSVSQ